MTGNLIRGGIKTAHCFRSEPGRPRPRTNALSWRRTVVTAAAIALSFVASASFAFAQAEQEKSAPSARNNASGKKGSTDKKRDELEAKFAKVLSGATLEGSFSSTSGGDGSRLSKEKYVLGEVKKLAENIWLIPARIQYGEHDVTLPVTVPIRWAGDTPVITVDNMELPGFGTVSARVMFFEGHYAGYWKHGEHGGHLFGIIKPGDVRAAASKDATTREKSAPSGLNAIRGEKKEQ